MTHLLDNDSIERCINSETPAIAPGEPFQNLISVVVGAGVHRLKTVALHSRVSGKGSRIEKQPRRIDVVATPLDSMSEDWAQDARQLAQYIRGLDDCAVYVDSSGLGSMFAARLALELGESPLVRQAHWSAKPVKGESWNRHFTLREQGMFHAAEAIKDGRATITTTDPIPWIEQGLHQPYHVRRDGQLQMASQDERRRDGIPPADCFDALCIAFMETVQ